MTALLAPLDKDIGFPIRRLLPSRQRQAVGPFLFFDHMGPAQFAAGTTEGDVRPHPHIGLATVTYMFSGAMLHRDSLGTVQRIEPGAINLMQAGRGVVHSERVPADIRDSHTPVQGLQLWMALPKAHEDDAPSFAHHAAADLPTWQDGGATFRLLIGEWAGRRSPVATPARTRYVDVQLAAGATLELPADEDELALYAVDGDVTVGNEDLPRHHLLVLDAGRPACVQAGPASVRLMLLGGEPLDGRRHIDWNFVASTRERIAAARDAWQRDTLGQVPGETERIPLPQQAP